jgi:hypothetical protein
MIKKNDCDKKDDFYENWNLFDSEDALEKVLPICNM